MFSKIVAVTATIRIVTEVDYFVKFCLSIKLLTLHNDLNSDYSNKKVVLKIVGKLRYRK